MNFAYVLDDYDENELRYAILMDLYNQTALGWPPFVEQKFALQDQKWLSHMLIGIEY